MTDRCYGVDMSAMESFGYQLENGSFPDDAERGKCGSLFSDALYSFFNTKKKSHNRVDPYPDQNGNIPKAVCGSAEGSPGAADDG